MPLSLDGTGSITGIGTFNFSDEIVHVGDINTKIRFPANDTISFETAGSEKLRIDSVGLNITGITTIRNASGVKLYEGVANGSKLFHAGTERLSTELYGIDINGTLGADQVNCSGIVTATSADISGNLTQTGSGNIVHYINTGNNSGDNSTIAFGDTADADVGYINYDHGLNQFQIRTNGGSNSLIIDSSGHLSINGSNVTDANYLTINGSGASNNIGIVLNKTNSPARAHGIQVANTTGDLVFYDYSASAERFRIDSSGDMGLGTGANIDRHFHVQGTDNIQGKFENNAAICMIEFQDSNTTAGNRPSYGAVGNNGVIHAGGSERVRINSSGDMSLGSGATVAGLRYFDVQNASSAANSHGSILRLITSNAAGNGTTSVDMVKYKDGNFYINNNETSGSINFNTGGSTRLTIDSSGYVTHPSQPCMCVGLVLSGINNTGDLFANKSGSMSYDVNNGNIAFNSSNGRFTVPITGNYLVSFYSIKEGNGVSGYVDITINGVAGSFLRAYSQNSATSWSTYSAFAIKTLSSGDYINVNMPVGGQYNAHGNQHLRFVISLYS